MGSTVKQRFMVIAVIKDFSQVSAGSKANTIGYRLFDTESASYVDYTLADKGGINFCMKHANEFINVTPMVGNKLNFKFTNGAESRYPVLNQMGALVGKNPLVIVKEFNDGYRIVDAFGHTFDWSDQVTLEYAGLQGIANGKQVVLNGKPHISSILGQYPKENISITEKAVEKEEVKGEPVKTYVFPETFYKSLEPGFGGKASVDILRHLFEERGMANKQILGLLKSTNGSQEAPMMPAIMGMMVLGNEWKENKGKTKDQKLQKLTSAVVEKPAMELVYDMARTYNVYPDELWTEQIATPVYKGKGTTKNIQVTEGYIAAKVVACAMKSGKTFYGCSVNEDASEVVYEGRALNNPKYESYMISGITKARITLTNGSGKTIQLKPKATVAKTE